MNEQYERRKHMVYVKERTKERKKVRRKEGRKKERNIGVTWREQRANAPPPNIF
jgi:hypothetical protein